MIVVALNDNKEFVPIELAKRGQNYYCPCCFVKLIPCRYASRRDHYRIESEKHKSHDCHSLDKSEHIARDITYLEKEKFFGHLDKEPGLPRKGRNRGDPGPPPSREEKVLAPANLSQLMALGAKLWDPDEKFLNGQFMHDILVRYEGIAKYLREDQPFGERVLELHPDSAVANRILFVARAGENQRIFFSLLVPDEMLFTTLVNELFTSSKMSYKGQVWRKPKYNKVFVMAQWSWLKSPACKKHCIYCNTVNGKKPYGICKSMQEGILHRRGDIWW